MDDKQLVTASERAGGRVGARQGPLSSTVERNIVRAWERFAAGAQVVEGVRPEIVASWQRCRDQYQVDPHRKLAPGAEDLSEPPPGDESVFVELGAFAAEAMRRIDLSDRIVTVSDGAGKVLYSLGSQRACNRAAESNLARWSAWSERASGTNGMGTALQASGPVSVVGAEHWCVGFQQWACAGIAIRDVVTGSPIAAFNISRWRAPLPAEVMGWLARMASVIETSLRRRASQDGQRMVEAFTEEEATAEGAIACLDLGGRVLIANSGAGDLLGVPAELPMLDPAKRRYPGLVDMTSTIRWAARRATRDPQWVGSVQVPVASGEDPLDATLRPVFVANRLRGMVCRFGVADGETFSPARVDRSAPAQTRIAGVRGHRVVLLSLSEIRFCEADGNTVWLDTDRGRVQAIMRGLDNLESTLRSQGFHRVHRRYLVNLRRVLEVERGSRGELFLVTDPRNPVLIPVARRQNAEVKAALGL